MRYPTITALAALAALPSTFATPPYRRQNYQSMVYDFASLTPSPDFQWTPCFDDFTCTILEVPLDYKDTAAGTTGIAFIRWSTNNTNASSVQDIIINPGGPGGSGVGLVRDSLSILQESLGMQNNIIGMDPRGVNNSGPDISCFPGQDNTLTLYDRDWRQAVDANDTKTLADTWARAGAFGEWCSHVHSGGNSSAKYVNTVATATDMLHYTELLAKSKREDPDKSQLWYWGISYGTVLGSTFAALFPDRVGRMVLDGVVDAEDYYQGKWEANLPDADTAVESFFKYCYEGGQDVCVFWANSPSAIKERYNAVIEKLKDRPVIVTNQEVTQMPIIITYTDFKIVLVGVPYQPNLYFPILAQALVELEQGIGDTIAAYSGEGFRFDHCSKDPQFQIMGDAEPRLFIGCNDANGRFNLTDYDAYLDHVDFLVDQSRYLGEAWAAGVGVNCRSLNIQAPKSQVFTGPPSANKTSTPILFLSNTIDPVTPHRAAEKMVKLFGGARLLTQEAVGHTTFLAPSKCTMEYVSKYIEDATLPPEGTMCEVDEVPFKSGNSTNTEERKKLLRRRHML